MKNGLILSLGVMTGLVTAFDGGMILANQMVGDKQYSEAEFQEYGEQQREEGYNEGLTVNVGYSEEDLQNAYNEGLNSGISQSEETISNLNELIDFLAGGVSVNATYGNIEFVSSFNESVEGLWIHNTETGEYKKIISSGTSFNCMNRNNDNTLVLITGNLDSTTQGGYVYNLETGQIVMFSETGQWEINPFSDGNADFLIFPSSSTANQELSGEGIYYFHSDEMRAEQIISTGKNWRGIGAYENKENHLLYYFSSHSSDELGLYAYDTTSMELITVASEGCNYQYFQSLGDKQVIACSLGLVEINDDGTINVLIANETGQIDVIYDVHPNNIVVDFSNVYRYNIESETFKQIDFGVSSVTDMQFEVGVYYILNNEESKFVVYSVSEDQIFTVNSPENLQIGQVFDYNFGDGGNYMTVSALPLAETGMYRTYHIDFDAGTIEEVVE